jgi:hypothetical protein
MRWLSTGAAENTMIGAKMGTHKNGENNRENKQSLDSIRCSKSATIRQPDLAERTMKIDAFVSTVPHLRSTR